MKEIRSALTEYVHNHSISTLWFLGAIWTAVLGNTELASIAVIGVTIMHMIESATLFLSERTALIVGLIVNAERERKK